MPLVPSRRSLACLLFACAFPGSSARGADFPELSASLGVEVTDGKYGGSSNVRVIETPFTVRLEGERHILAVTFSHLEVTSESAAVVGDGAVLLSQQRSTERVRVSGAGDLISAWTYKLPTGRDSPWLINTVSKVKFGTANAERGLGTGKNDYSFQFDVARHIGRFTPGVELGYKFRGRPADFELRDSGYASIGTRYRIDSRTRLDAYLDYRQPAAPNAAPQRELSLYLSYRVVPQARLQLYVIKGYSTSSPDRGAGMKLTVAF